jgi:enoyl-CoA hydratase/carnithine racemase
MGILRRSDGPISVVTLDWPQQRNALDVDAMRELAAALRTESGRTGVAAVVLTGSGAFCAGADLRRVVSRQSLSDEERRAGVRDAAQALILSIVDAPVPVLAAIDGPAVGLGFDLALACDERFVGREGWCMQGWGRIGAIPATGGELLLRLRNPMLLWHLLADQPRIEGPACERWGLGWAVEGETALDAALARGAALAQLPLPALHAYVRLARSNLRAQLVEHLALCADEQPRLLADRGIGGRIDRVLGTTKEETTS